MEDRLAGLTRLLVIDSDSPTAAEDDRRLSRYKAIDEALWRYLSCASREKGYSTFVQGIKKRLEIVLQSPINVITKHFI